MSPELDVVVGRAHLISTLAPLHSGRSTHSDETSTTSASLEQKRFDVDPATGAAAPV